MAMAVDTERRGRSTEGPMGGVFGTSHLTLLWGLKAPSLNFPTKDRFRSPRTLSGGGSFPQPKFYPLGRDSEKSSNSLQELADEQRLRKLSTGETRSA